MKNGSSIVRRGVCTRLLCCSIGIIPGCAATQRTYIAARNPQAPYSRAILIGDTLFIAGDGVLDPETSRPYDDPRTEAHKLMQSIQETLADAGMTCDDLVHVTVYCSDLALYDIFNEVYRGYFEREFPSRAFIGAGDLLWGMRFEIQAMAVKRR